MTEESNHKELILKSEEIRKQAAIAREAFGRLLDLIELEFCIPRKDTDGRPNPNIS